MSKENALTIGLVPTEFNRSPVFIKSLDNPDTDDAIAMYQSRCTAARQLNGTEADVRRCMDMAQAEIYPGETVFGRDCVYADLSPYRQTNVLDLITDAVIRVQVEDRLLFESLGIDLDVLAQELADANAGRPTSRPLADIFRDVRSLPAEHMRRVLNVKPKSRTFRMEKIACKSM